MNCPIPVMNKQAKKSVDDSKCHWRLDDCKYYGSCCKPMILTGLYFVKPDGKECPYCGREIKVVE